MIKSKKGLIGTGMSWFFGTIVIIFILVVYSILSAFLLGKPVDSGGNIVTDAAGMSINLRVINTKRAEAVPSDILLTKTLYAFLNTLIQPENYREDNLKTFITPINIKNDKIIYTIKDKFLYKFPTNFYDLVNLDYFPALRFILQNEGYDRDVTLSDGAYYNLNSQGYQGLLDVPLYNGGIFTVLYWNGPGLEKSSSYPRGGYADVNQLARLKGWRGP